MELLNGVNGLRQIGEENPVKISVQGITVRVLDPISCLKAKIANAAGIDQTTRQDVKYFQIMKMFAREYAKDILMAGEQKILSERAVVDLLQNLDQISCSSEAVRVTQKWGVTFEDVMLLEAVEKSALGKVQNFYRLGLRRQFSQPRIQFPSPWDELVTSSGEIPCVETSFSRDLPSAGPVKAAKTRINSGRYLSILVVACECRKSR